MPTRRQRQWIETGPTWRGKQEMHFEEVDDPELPPQSGAAASLRAGPPPGTATTGLSFLEPLVMEAPRDKYNAVHAPSSPDQLVWNAAASAAQSMGGLGASTSNEPAAAASTQPAPRPFATARQPGGFAAFSNAASWASNGLAASSSRSAPSPGGAASPPTPSSSSSFAPPPQTRRYVPEQPQNISASTALFNQQLEHQHALDRQAAEQRVAAQNGTHQQPSQQQAHRLVFQQPQPLASTSHQQGGMSRVPVISSGAAARTPSTMLHPGAPGGSLPGNKPTTPQDLRDFYRQQSEQARAAQMAAIQQHQQQQQQQAQMAQAQAQAAVAANGGMGPMRDVKGKGKAVAAPVIDLTNSDSEDEVKVQEKYVCMGQLMTCALILYPIKEIQGPPTPRGPDGVPLHAPQLPPVAVTLYRQDGGRGPQDRPTLRVKSWHTGEDFACMETRTKDAIEPLMGVDGVFFGMGVDEARNPRARLWVEAVVLPQYQSSPMMLPLRMLLFCRHEDLNRISKHLADRMQYLEHPVSYEPAKHGGWPYHNPHLGGALGAGLSLNPREAEKRRALYTTGLYGGGGIFTTQKVKSTADVQRQQVEDVFKNLKSGMDLEETDPPATVTTKLYPHQKQALSFVLDREKLIDTRDNVEAGETIDVDREETVVSLWERTRDPKQRPKGWRSLVTNLEIVGASPPPQARGCILADDMGLGKTIVVISLIVTTLPAAREYASTALEAETYDQRFESLPGTNDSKKKGAGGLTAEAAQAVTNFNQSLPGVDPKVMARMTNAALSSVRPDEGTSAAPKKGNSKKAKAKEAREKRRDEAAKFRFEKLVVKSRATLIVCPLSTVQNWESQIEEHVSGATSSPVKLDSDLEDSDEDAAFRQPKGKGKKPLKVYVYHGPSRTSDPLELADYDVVITTFATVGAEFSKQSRADRAKEDQEAANGKEPAPVESPMQSEDSEDEDIKPGTKRKRGRKAKKDPKDTNSPLQVIQWFRIVLDEAHVIKEHTTIQARAACELSASRRLALSGTPLQNSLNDLYSLVRFLRLEPFTDRGIWTHNIGALVKANDPLGVTRLQLIMRHLALRRTKDSKDKDGKPILSLPPNNQSIVYQLLDPAEHAFYSSHHTRYKHDFEQLQDTDTVLKNYCSILQELLRLRQICVHPGLVRDSEDLGAMGGDLIETIKQHGLSKPRAIQLIGMMRDGGAAACAECFVDFSAAGDDSNDLEVDGEDKKPARKARKTGKAATASAPTSDDDGSASTGVPSWVVTRCQHFYCIKCFREHVSATFPHNVKADDRVSCSVCKADLTPAIDAIDFPTLELERELAEADGERSTSKSSKTRLVEHSTKVKALLRDIHPFSQANPSSANYFPDMDQFESENKTIGFQPIKGEVVKSVVFSQWTKLLDRISDALVENNIKFGRLDGGMTRDARTRAMDEFKADPACEVLLVSLRAGGVGLNLTAGRRVYIMEPYWNPAVEHQAVDRIHRLGQTMPVQTVRFIIQKSIEENMLKVQKRKLDLANLSMGRTLSKAELAKQRVEDIRTLLE